MRSDSTPVEYVLRTAEERGVRFVRLWFVDVLGLLKSSSIPVSELEQALEEGVGLDGSSLESGTRLFELDVIAHPDPTTFELLPWRPGRRGRADVLRHRPARRDAVARRLARGAAPPARARSAELGYTFQVGPEIEFFLFESKLGERRRRRRSTTARTSTSPRSTTAATSAGATIEYLEQMGIPVKASHHEVAPSQHEIDLKHTDALSMADAITTFRLTVKEVARELGVYATFMPKPLDGQPGSGMHLHLSLLRRRTAATRSTTRIRTTPLSPIGRAFLAGVLAPRAAS